MRHPATNPAVLRNDESRMTTAWRHPRALALPALLGLLAVAQLAPAAFAADRSRPTTRPSAAAVDEGEVQLASARSSDLLRTTLVTPSVTPSAKARTLRMLVTAYCPCVKCCGPNAQGITASGKPVTHNGGRFVAADRRILPLYKRLVVPGYHADEPVQVLDTGSAIKGYRLDVYFPSHQTALEWGKQWLDVTVVE